VPEGAVPPGGRGRGRVAAEVLKALKRRSLAKLRKQVEPVDPAALARFVADWQGLARPRRGLDALLGAVEQLQGAPLVASALEREVLSARIQPLRPGDLDILFSAGELIWRGVEPVGSRDGRIALYLTDHYRLLAPPPKKAEGALCEKLRQELRRRGASFFADLTAATGAFPADLLKALWDLVWAGEVTNDTLAPLRSYLRGPPKEDRRTPHLGRPFRSPRLLRRRARGRPVRRARRRGSAAQLPRRASGTGDDRACGDRSREPLRRGPALAACGRRGPRPACRGRASGAARRHARRLAQPERAQPAHVPARRRARSVALRARTDTRPRRAPRGRPAAGPGHP